MQKLQLNIDSLYYILYFKFIYFHFSSTYFPTFKEFDFTDVLRQGLVFLKEMNEYFKIFVLYSKNRPNDVI